MEHRFLQVDVFTRVAFAGNPVAVVFDADGLDEARMQTIARWTNLSETTFLSAPTQPGADYRLRIFTPHGELPFAGHPTIGTAHALLHAGFTPRTPGRLVQECGAGLVEIRTTSHAHAFRVPPAPLESISTAHREAVEDALGLTFVAPPMIARMGPQWLVGPVASADALLAMRFDPRALGESYVNATAGGVAPFALRDDGAIEVRSFAPAHGLLEDPVTGSSNAAIAVYRRHLDPAQSDYTAFQGRVLGRDGRISIRYEGEAIWVGGDAIVCVEGRLHT